jgi:hypothetical protein
MSEIIETSATSVEIAVETPTVTSVETPVETPKSAVNIQQIVEQKKKSKKKHPKKKIFDDLVFNRLNPEEKAKFLWEKYKSVRPTTTQEIDTLYKEFTMEYKTFHEMFPVVLRYMCQLGKFNAKAFHRFLIKMQHNPPKNQEELIVDRNADYLRYLWEEEHPKFSKAQSNIVWTDAYKILKDDFDKYLVVEAEAKERIKKQQEIASEEKKNELLALVNARKAASSTAQ